MKTQWTQILEQKEEIESDRDRCKRCKGECKLTKFENSKVKRIFKKELIETDLNMAKKIKSYLLQEKSDKIDGQNLILEMYLVSLKDTEDWSKGFLRKAFVVSILQAILLPIWDAF